MHGLWLCHPRPWLPCLVSGALLALAFPCHPQHPLAFLFHSCWAWVALVPLFAVLPGGGFAAGFRRGWLTGFTFSGLSLYWVAHTQGGGLAVVGGTGLMAAYLGLFVGVFAGAQNLLVRRWGARAWWAGPLLWTAQEYLLSLGQLGFPWLLLGHSQAVFTSLIQYAALTGVYGVSLWVGLLNVLVFMALSRGDNGRAQPNPPTPPRVWLPAAARRWPVLAVLALALLVPWLYGRAVIPSSPAAEKTVRVALVQPNLAWGEKWGADGLARSFDRLEELSRRAAALHPDLLVWPETALPCYLRAGGCRARVERLVEELGIPVLTGASDYDTARGEPRNAAFLVSPGASGLQSYAKMHLVPFGERTPFRDSIPVLRDIDWTALTGALGPAEFAPGRERTIFAHDRAPFAVLICFESVFPDLVRRSVAEGATMLVNITNDSWFGRTAGPYQHAQLAVLRAVENRTAVARCATTGISVFIDPFGRTSQATGIFESAASVGDIPLGRGRTPYTRYGDLFAQVVLLASLGLTGLVLARERSEKRQA